MTLVEEIDLKSDLKPRIIGHSVKLRLAHTYMPQSTQPLVVFYSLLEQPVFSALVSYTQTYKIRNSHLVFLQPVGILNLSKRALFLCLHSLVKTQGGLQEFETVMQTLDVGT